MIDAIIQLILFLVETAIIVIAILIIIAGIAGACSSKDKETRKNKITIKKLNKHFKQMANDIKKAILTKKEYKKLNKANKKDKKQTTEKRVFVIDFQGDIKASQTDQLREEVSAVLHVATPKDEVVIRLESPGGMVPHYGLAASQLIRIRHKNIPLTVCVDRVAASGGYLMSCVANKIIASPFAIIGSVGVVAQLPNFYRYLQNKKIDFEQFTAGEYKRTVSVFGENTKAGREKLTEELNEIHDQFKQFVSDNRPQLNIDRIATGEHWLGQKAYELKLVDELTTSDDYLMKQAETADCFQITYQRKKRLAQRFAKTAELTVNKILFSWWQTNRESRFM